MKANLNPYYIKYKVSSNASAYYQFFSKKTAELFIINDNLIATLNVFPEFIRNFLIKDASNVYLDRAAIKINRIDDIIYDVIHTVYQT